MAPREPLRPTTRRRQSHRDELIDKAIVDISTSLGGCFKSVFLAVVGCVAQCVKGRRKNIRDAEGRRVSQLESQRTAVTNPTPAVIPRNTTPFPLRPHARSMVAEIVNEDGTVQSAASPAVVSRISEIIKAESTKAKFGSTGLENQAASIDTQMKHSSGATAMSAVATAGASDIDTGSQVHMNACTPKTSEQIDESKAEGHATVDSSEQASEQATAALPLSVATPRLKPLKPIRDGGEAEDNKSA